MSDDLHWMTAADLACTIRSREVSSREATQHLLDRIERLDGPINSVVLLDAERALREADAADAAIAAGKQIGPLAGVPMTVKDSFSTEGMTTTSGAPELADHVPIEDAAPVARLREAGAVIIGKTNLPIYAGDLQSYNDVYGTTNNPHDVETSPGGSSGGSSAALAAGFTPLEVGSDIGGSIRFPAHNAGVVGIKPSYGAVPAHGQIPGPPGTLTQADLAVAGPMARDIDDLELALGLMAGPDRWNHPAWSIDLPAARSTDIEDFRIAAWLDDPHCPVGSEVSALLNDAVGALSDAGAAVDTDARPGFSLEKVHGTFEHLLSAALAGGASNPEVERYASATGDDALSRAKRRTAMRHREWLTHNERRLQMRRRMEEFFDSFDVLLLPVSPAPAQGHDHSEPMVSREVVIDGVTRPYWDLNTWMAPAGVCYLPATVVPVGTTEGGLPVGIQIVGPYLHDRTTLQLGRMLLGLCGGVPRPAGF